MNAFPQSPTGIQEFATSKPPLCFAIESWTNVFKEPSIEKRTKLAFEWLSELSAGLESTPESMIKQDQQRLEQQLYTFLHPTSAPIAPTKAIRHLVCNCFLSLIGRGDSRRAYDLLTMVQTSLKGVTKHSKDDKDSLSTPTLILHLLLLGHFSQKFGSQYLSIFSETVYLLLKLLKGINDVHSRIACIEAFTRSTRGCSRGLNETHVKDVVKLLKTFLVDKNMSIRRAASESLSTLAKEHCLTLQTLLDFETYLSFLIKGFEGADYETRIAIAKSIAIILSSSQAITIMVPLQSSKINTKKKKADASEETPSQKAVEKTLLSCSEMLNLLSAWFLKSNLQREYRIGLAEAYVHLFQILGSTFVGAHYTEFISHFINEVLSNPKFLTFPNPEMVCIKSLVLSLLSRLGEQLSEAHQLLAVKFIIEKYISTWSSDQNFSGAILNEWALNVLLYELAHLIYNLSGISSSLQDLYLDPMLKVSAHPSHLVQTSVAWCLMHFVLYSPSLFVSFFSTIFNTLSKEVPNILSNVSLDVCRRYIGYSILIAALLHISQLIPLYVPANTYLQVFSLASTLLKSNAKEVKDMGDVKKMICVREVAWNLILGLMTSGSSPVKLHLNQCLLLWKDAFPKNLPSNNAERHVLLHEKEAALRSIIGLLMFNTDLLNQDIQKKISVLICNALRLMLSHPCFTSNNASGTLPLNLPIVWNTIELEQLFKKRLFDSVSLLPISSFEEFYPQLMNRATEIFAQDFNDSKKFEVGTIAQIYHGLDKQLPPINSMFGLVFWHGTEYGITTLPTHFQPSDTLWKYGYFKRPDTSCLMDYEQWLSMEVLLFHPVPAGNEFDIISIFQFDPKQPLKCLEPSPPSFGLINSSILLASNLFPAFVPSIQEAFLETMIRLARQKPEKQGRKTSFLVNLLYMLYIATNHISNLAKTTSISKQSAKLIFELANMCMSFQDAGVRYISSYLIGKTAELTGLAVFSHFSQCLVHQIVEKADSPELRCASALSLSMLHVHTRSSTSIKSTISILQELCNDTHPMVSYWALVALALLFEQSGADVINFIDHALHVAFKQLLQESRPLFTGTLLYRCVDALGPELRISEYPRQFICQMTDYLINSCDFEENAEAFYTVSHMLLMVPNAFPVSKFAALLQMPLSSSHTTLRHAALTCLCQMIQRFPEQVLMATENLENTLLALVKEFPSLVKKCIASLVEVTQSPSRWIDLCRQFLTGSVQGIGNQAPASGTAIDTEDDSEGLAGSSTNLPKNDKKPTQVKWHSQLAALEALRLMIAHFAKQNIESHFHFQPDSGKQKRRDWLVYRLGDLIRVAFTASTSLSQKVRAEGLCLLEDVLDHFSNTKDPDYEGHMLLEQYQAQFSSALTPAFHPDAHPEILSKACRVCARYIGSGITEELFTLSRIIKLMTQALEVSQKPLPSLSEHAQIVVSVAVYGAWADLHNMCQSNAPLAEIVKPQLPLLIPLWSTLLFEYAIIKLEPLEYHLSLSQLENISRNLVYATSNRQNVLKIYKSTWVSILSAVTSLCSSDSFNEHLKKFNLVKCETSEINQLILILLGLSFEPLVSVGTPSQMTQICLDGLIAIFNPRYIPALPSNFIPELVCMADRLLQTESPPNQLKVAQFTLQLLTSYQSDIPTTMTKELIRIMVAIVARTLPEILVDPSTAEIFINKSDDGIALAIEALKIISFISTFHREWIPLTFHLFSVAFQSELFASKMTPLTLVLKTIFEKDVDTTLACSFVITLLHIVENSLQSNPDLAKPSLVAATLVGSIISSISLVPVLSSIFQKCFFVPQLSLTTFQCVRSIISKKSGTQEFIDLFVVTILPHLLHFALTEHSLPMQECVHVLGIIGCLDYSTETVLSGLVGILVKFPTFLQLKPTVATQLLNIANQQGHVFRQFLQKLPSSSKQSLETCLRSHHHSHSVGYFPNALQVS